MTRLLIAGVLLGFSVAQADRLQDDHDAKAAFLKLHFYEDGRGMHLAPGAMDILEAIPGQTGGGLNGQRFKYKYGINVENKEPVGLFKVPFENRTVGVLGCVICHSGRAAGVFIPGLGNKNIDVVAIAKDAYNIQKALKPFFGGKKYQEIRDSALQFSKELADEKVGNLTQGHVTVSFIRRWFYKMAGLSLPQDMTRGAVKIPALWGYGEKRPVGQFSDGFGNGNYAGWAIAVELTAGQDVQTVRNYMPKVEAAEELFSYFLPVEYPFTINQTVAAQGEKIFSKTCSGCHGTYEKDNQNLPVFKAPVWVSIATVKTDTDRLASNTTEFFELVAQNPLNDVIQANSYGAGYFAPRLVGIWSRFPYLHNASVPSLADLLTPPAQRPRYFSLRDAGEASRFDQQRVGLTMPAAGSKDDKKLAKAAKKGDRDVFFGDRIGHSPEGHSFGTTMPDVDKLAVIEYLKTL